ncbi:MAG: hypothetical protein DHS20C18_23730 [Saprospiraceae bacterium]|nr:MAG: hypothetical protein DHS20C18_23730 [Saprospiraceae bacterium]
MNHQKHTKLTRPDLGQFGRNEWAIIGTPCGNIQQLATQLITQLSAEFKMAYVDADHQSADQEAVQGKDPKSPLAHGATLVYTDKITHHRFEVDEKLDNYQYRQWFNGQDLVLVNGNHFVAKQQIVVIDPKKESSLAKKLDRLTDVRLILLTDDGQAIYPFLQEHLGDQKPAILNLNDTDKIANWLKQEMAATKPPLFGLVLAGGKSQRMGQDKGLIDYHGKPQREYAADLLSTVCDEVYLSCRSEQAGEIESAYPLLPDTFTGLGPFGAIASAFRAYPNNAWLVIACDLPLLDGPTLTHLNQHRNLSKIATAFQSPVNEFPEPLIAIWEPRAYPVLLQFLAQGYSCPRKVLINSEIELIEVAKAEKLMNVNLPEEVDVVKGRLR